MFMKNRIVRALTYSALSLICLYTGISCILTFRKVHTQPYLISGAVRFDFMGYSMLAMINGAVCIVSALALIFFSVRMKKRKSK